MAGKQWKTTRKETKYYVTLIQYTILKSLLSSVMEIDDNACENGDYFVRSVYFDSRLKMDLNEKEIGVSHRRKIRFRYYSYHPEIIKFEIKEKFNKHTIKKSQGIRVEEAKEIFNENLEVVNSINQGVYNHMTSYGYSPSRLIDYEREAYVSDFFDIRINFDKNIRGTSDCSELFKEHPMMVPLIDTGLYILEVKHNGHIPDHIQKILASVDLTAVSYSKYYYGCLI